MYVSTNKIKSVTINYKKKKKNQKSVTFSTVEKVVQVVKTVCGTF